MDGKTVCARRRLNGGEKKVTCICWRENAARGGNLDTHIHAKVPNAQKTAATTTKERTQPTVKLNSAAGGVPGKGEGETASPKKKKKAYPPKKETEERRDERRAWGTRTK